MSLGFGKVQVNLNCDMRERIQDYFPDELGHDC